MSGAADSFFAQPTLADASRAIHFLQDGVAKNQNWFALSEPRRARIIHAIRCNLFELEPSQDFYLYWACMRLDINIFEEPWMLEPSLSIGQRLAEFLDEPTIPRAEECLPAREFPKIIWALAVSLKKYGVLHFSSNIIGAIEKRLVSLEKKIDELDGDTNNIFQLLQVRAFLNGYFAGRPHIGIEWPSNITDFLNARSAMQPPVTVSTFEINVLSKLRRIYGDITFAPSRFVPTIFHDIDIAVPALKIAIEVDSVKYHYYKDQPLRLTTRTWFRNQLLKAADWQVVSINSLNELHIKGKLHSVLKLADAAVDHPAYDPDIASVAVVCENPFDALADFDDNTRDTSSDDETVAPTPEPMPRKPNPHATRKNIAAAAAREATRRTDDSDSKSEDEQPYRCLLQ